MIKATYISHMGNDELVVDAARASFDKVASKYSQEKNSRLIKYLAKHNHWTPFSHPQITLLHEVPIFVARQEFKHVIGFTRNERSRRYVDDTPEFYVPDEWRERPSKDKKQGSGGVSEYTDIVSGLYKESCRQALIVYNRLINEGIAPEQARMILPQSMMTSYYVTGSLAAFARAYKLRIAPDSQKEIQDLAKQWDSIIKPLYPESWKALTRP